MVLLERMAGGSGFAAGIALPVVVAWVQVTLVLAAGWALARLMRGGSAAVRSANHRGTLACAAICPLVSIALNASGVGGLGPVTPGVGDSGYTLAAPARSDAGEARAGLANPPAGPSRGAGTSVAQAGRGGQGSLPRLPAGERRLAADVHGSAIASGTAVLLVVWLAGAAALLGRTVWGAWRLSRICRSAGAAGEETLRRCEAVARSLGVTPPAVRLLDGLASPCLAGVFRPTMLLPVGHEADRDVLLHEVAHAARRDCAWMLGARVLACTFWAQPLAWRLCRELAVTADEACDDVVLHAGADRRGYATRLLDLAAGRELRLPVGAVGAVMSRSALSRRIERIVDDSRFIAPRLGRAGVAIATSGCLAVALVGGALGAARLQAANPDEVVHLHGRVVDAEGKPIAGAAVAVATVGGWDSRFERHPIAKATAAADGTFKIEFRKADVSPFTTGGGTSGENNWKRAQVMATADGHGIGWRGWGRTDADGGLTLRLPKDDVPIHGRIVDAQHQPVTGVKVLLVDVRSPREGDWANLSEDERADIGTQLPRMAMGDASDTVTDADGRFMVRGIGRDRVADFRVCGPRVGYSSIAVRTLDGAATVRDVPQPIGTVEHFTTYGADFEFVAPPAASVTGQVRDAATGKPMAGVPVQSLWFAGPFGGFDPQGVMVSVTDAEGRYALEGMPAGKGNRIIAVPTDGQPYLMRVADVPEGPTAKIDLELHRGVVVTGKVTEKGTGKPVAARMSYTTYRDNPNATDLPEFPKRYGLIDGYQGRYETKAGGNYRLVAIPGKAIITTWVLNGGYRVGVGHGPELNLGDMQHRTTFGNPLDPQFFEVLKVVEIPAGATSVTCDLEVDPGSKVHASIVGADGKPITGRVQVRGQVHERYGGPYFKAEGAEFDAIALSPDEKRSIYVIDDVNGLGCTEHVTAGMPNVTLKLLPLAAVSGRLVDGDGKPLAKAEIEVEEDGGRTVRSVVTDEDGRFRATLPVGGSYRAMVWSGPYSGYSVMTDVTPDAGESHDLGDVTLRLKRGR